MKKTQFLQSLIGTKISSINRICNLISLTFSQGDENSIFLHIQSFFRVLEKNKLVLSSEDIYRCGNMGAQDNFSWDIPGQTIFDDMLEQKQNLLLNAVVVDCQQNKNEDLIIVLDNDIVIEIFIDTTENEEKYRLFNNDECLEIYSN